MPDQAVPDQLALIGPRGGLLPRSSPRRSGRPAVADVDPVARVLLDSPLPRLDRTFDYAVPAALDQQVRFGAKVRVRFGRGRTEGWVVGRSAQTDHRGPLQPIEAVANPEPVLTPDSLRLCRAVAEHYLGTVPDVLRLAIPPRSGTGRARQAPILLPAPRAGGSVLRPGPGRWVWTCPPGTDWADWFADTLAATARDGGRALAVVPDGSDVGRLASALARSAGPDAFAVLSGHEAPGDRYAAFQAVLQDVVPLVIGTRSAALAPIAEPDLLLLWDDSDDSHSERRAPYPHARELLGIRSRLHPGSLIVGSYGRSPACQRWIEIGWARELGHDRTAVRRTAPRVSATDDDQGPAGPSQRVGRLPAAAGAAIRAALPDGPVLVCVGRRGYIPRLRCGSCRAVAACVRCGGALLLSDATADPSCGTCGAAAPGWTCPECGGDRLRWGAVGVTRTAEELGRAFPGVPVVISTGSRAVPETGSGGAIVVATPGAEPHASDGYSAAVVLDVAEALSIPGVRGRERAAHRWFALGGLLRPRAALVMVADPGQPVVQALLRWDPAWLAAGELAQRRDAGMVPAVKQVSVTGDVEALSEVQAAVPAFVVVHGPLGDGQRRTLHLVAPHRQAAGLLEALRALVHQRSAAGAAPLSVRVDPDG